MKRGIGKLKVGQLFVMGIAGMMDENFHYEVSGSKDDIKDNIKKEVQNRVKVPAIILNKKFTEDEWPIYDIGFWTRGRSGEMSGMLEMKGVCIWRYFASDDTLGVEEGTPPEWLIKTLDEGYDFDIKREEIFYIKAKDDNPDNDYRYYPFKEVNYSYLKYT